MNWQRKARAAVAVVGAGVAVTVFFAVGERRPPAAVTPPAQLDPKAVLESSDVLFRQVQGVREDYEVKALRQVVYEDGSLKLLDVAINVRGREGRDFVMTGSEARAVQHNSDIVMTGGVTLIASDGFEITTDQATFSDSDGVVRAEGALAFRRGRMRGTGAGMTFDQAANVLTIVDRAEVTLAGGPDTTAMAFSGDHAVLSREDDSLVIDGGVRAHRDGQLLEADHATAHLTKQDDLVTAIELRGHSRVSGGSGVFDAVQANDIDLQYAADGATLEQIVLQGRSQMTLAASSAQAGSKMAAESLVLELGADATLTSMTGRTAVQLDLPAGPDAPTRTVRSRTLDATGTAGKGLTTAVFSDDVEYQEHAVGAPGRVVRSRQLRASLDGTSITTAVFTGRVRFEERGLEARADKVVYDPGAGVLGLEGRDEDGVPQVRDAEVSIRADAIDLALEHRVIRARGGVKTELRPGASRTDGGLPGLLSPEHPVYVNATSLEYEGGRGVYTGDAQLWQGETALRARRIEIDRSKGDMVAQGDARSTVVLGTDTSIGRAERIRYIDADRRMEYGPAPATTPDPTANSSAGKSPPTPAPPDTAAAENPTPVATATLAGPQGDVRAEGIVAILAAGENRLDRLEADGRVTLRLDAPPDARVATGAQLIYHASDGRYVMSAPAGTPVKVVERCRETTGRTLTFFKAADRIIVDGNEEIRTQTRSGGTCPEPPAP